MQKTIIFTAILTALSLTGVAMFMKSEQAGSRMLSSQQLLAQSAFTAWKMKHGKSYGSDAEHTYRLQIFTENMKFINEHNNMPRQTSTVGLNKFSDLNTEEFGKQYAKGLMKRNLKSTRNVTIFNTDNIAASKDWRTEGAVTPVKNQGQCGSCWAFSTTGSVEGAMFIKTRTLQSYSEQMLVDCSKQNNGCNGGLMDYAFQYIEANGLELESHYPYTGQDGTCSYDESKAVGQVKSFTDVTPNSADQLRAALNVGPVSVAIEADQSDFQSYTSGVITGTSCGTQLDHGVLAVGYGTTDAGDAYFLVKNSWGASWGDNGYVKIGADNVCGILLQPSYPTE